MEGTVACNMSSLSCQFCYRYVSIVSFSEEKRYTNVVQKKSNTSVYEWRRGQLNTSIVIEGKEGQAKVDFCGWGGRNFQLLLEISKMNDS